MSAVGWLAVAAAVLLCAGPAAVPARAARLVDGARLAARPIAVPPRDWTSQRWLPGCGAVIAVAVVGRTGGAALAVALAAVVSCLALIARDAVRGRSRRARHADLLLAVRVLVGELAAGARPPAALDAAAEAAPSHREVLARAAREAAFGGEAGAVLVADAATHALGVAWQLGHGTGAALGGVLERVADDLAAVDEQRRAVDVALSGPRSSAAVLTGLPVLGVVLGAAMGAAPLSFLIGSSSGRLVCCAGVLLDVAGVLWMRRILRVAAHPTGARHP